MAPAGDGRGVWQLDADWRRAGRGIRGIVGSVSRIGSFERLVVHRHLGLRVRGRSRRLLRHRRDLHGGIVAGAREPRHTVQHRPRPWLSRRLQRPRKHLQPDRHGVRLPRGALHVRHALRHDRQADSLLVLPGWPVGRDRLPVAASADWLDLHEGRDGVRLRRLLRQRHAPVHGRYVAAHDDDFVPGVSTPWPPCRVRLPEPSRTRTT